MATTESEEDVYPPDSLAARNGDVADESAGRTERGQAQRVV